MEILISADRKKTVCQEFKSNIQLSLCACAQKVIAEQKSKHKGSLYVSLLLPLYGISYCNVAVFVCRSLFIQSSKRGKGSERENALAISKLVASKMVIIFLWLFLLSQYFNRDPTLNHRKFSLSNFNEKWLCESWWELMGIALKVEINLRL